MCVCVLVGSQVWGQGQREREAAELAEAVNGAKVSLIRGLSASARDGEPISATSALQHGTLQLSVYTVERDQLLDVRVDPTTGKAITVEPITSGDRLAAAHAQRAAMAKAKWSLHTVAVSALKAHRGFRLVSIVPSLTAVERPIARVTLVKSDQWKTVAERLNEEAIWFRRRGRSHAVGRVTPGNVVLDAPLERGWVTYPDIHG